MAKAAKKAVEKKSGSGLKYADKSAGQPQLLPIFESLRKLMKPYAKGTIKPRGDSGGQFHLWSDKEIEVQGRKMKEVYFAGLLVQKGYVGFYFMPVYAEPGMKKILAPELLKCLKGKSCFYIKKLDSQLEAQIKDALQKGYESYKEKSWV